MSHIVPFTIDDLEFRHTEDDAGLDEQARERWRDLSEVATQSWRSEEWVHCSDNESNIPFAVFRDGQFYGTWVLYRARPVGGDEDTVSALPGPMFGDIAARIPEPALGPSGDIINADEIAAAEAVAAVFWRRMFGIMEWMDANPMPMHDGGALVVDHWRFPSVADNDPPQHEWVGVVPMFERYCKREVVWNDGATAPVRWLADWKETDPDPGRERGHTAPGS